MAQTALYDANFVANNLIRIADGKSPYAYTAKQPATVIPIGAGWAALDWRGFKVYGRLGVLLRHFADLIAYHDYEPWKIATKHWLDEWDTEEICPLCRDGLVKAEYLSGV